MQAVVQVHMFILALFDVDAMRIRKCDSASPREMSQKTAACDEDIFKHVFVGAMTV